MIYFFSTLSDTLTLLPAILLTNFIYNSNNPKRKTILTILICAVMSFVMTFCYTQENYFYDRIALTLYTLRYFTIIMAIYRNLKWNYLYIAVLCEYTISILNSSIANLFENFNNIQFKLMMAIISIVFNIIAIILICAFRNKICTTVKLIRHLVPKHLYILVWCALLCLSSLSTLNNYPTSDIETKGNIMNFIIVLFTFITAWIIFSLLVNVISKQYFSNTLAMMQNQVDIQIRHYDKLEKLNNEMHSFKHDYTNHLYSLRSLIQMNENDDAITYIDKLLNAKHSSHTMFCTGNKLADAILADKSDILPEGIEIEYQGIIPPTLDNLHLCVILTNALDNAIEECSKLRSPGKIKISAQEKQGYFVMTMINPTVTNLIFSDIPPTSKVDKEHHGMGLTNIRNVVKSYDGQMNINCENNYFELSIALKL